MKILSFNPGHDGAIAYLADTRLSFSIEAEKDSNYRYSPVSSHDVFNVLGDLNEVPDVICTGGWWPRDEFDHLRRRKSHADYRGVSSQEVIVQEKSILGRPVRYFSSSHERSHIFCAFGMSPFPRHTPCYALVWEGALGAFYELDSNLNITLLADVLSQPGNRYALLYGLADPTFPKDTPFFRFADAGKLMALAAFSRRGTPTAEEETLLDTLLTAPYSNQGLNNAFRRSPYYDVGVEDPEFRDFVGIYSDRIFEIFYQFAKSNLKKNLPLMIAGGCGLNCDWNSKWRDTGLFPEVFVPPVANDSGSAIGTAIDAQIHFTGNPKINWNVYAGRPFTQDRFEVEEYDVYEGGDELVADGLASNLIIGWVGGRYEIGPRALGNRSILAAPFDEDTRVRLNVIKQREQFRPIAPVCLEEDAARWFGCDHESQFMLYTYKATTDVLAAVTHVNGTARLQTVSPSSNPALYRLLTAFKLRTGYGVLCNTSLNFSGRGLINRMSDVSTFTRDRNLDGFVVDGRAYFLRASTAYQTYLTRRPSLTLSRVRG